MGKIIGVFFNVLLVGFALFTTGMIVYVMFQTAIYGGPGGGGGGSSESYECGRMGCN